MNWINRYSWLLVFLGGIVLVNWIGSIYHTRIDLTEERRFTLSDATYDMLDRLDGPLFVQVLLDGEFPAGFRRLQLSVDEILQDFRAINPELQYRFEDPTLGDPEQVKERMESYAQVGIVPTELNVTETSGQSRRQIYPFAIFNYGDRQIAINLLEGNSEGMSPEVALNNSISLLEYKFANAIAKLLATHKPNVLFTTGHGELSTLQTASLEGNLRAFYNTARIDLDSLYQIPEEIDLLVVAKPTKPFSQKDLFKLDQYVMHGGHVIFCLDPLIVNLDSIARNGQYVPHDNTTDLDDLLFEYGCKLVPNLVLDLQSSYIPLSTQQTGGNAQPQLFQWYYHPLVAGFGDHPIVKGLDRVELQFPATLDTVKTAQKISKTPLLKSSDYTRLQYNPVILDFNIIGSEPDPRDFNAGPSTVAMLLEGSFTSLFENRVSSSMLEGLSQIDAEFRSEGVPTSLLVISDGDIAKNLVNPLSGQFRPLGYNQYMNYTFDNQDFLTNAIEYMLDSNGLMEARAKTVKLRLLDRPRVEEEKVKWQLINVMLPVVLLVVFGWLFQYLRKRKYGRQTA